MENIEKNIQSPTDIEDPVIIGVGASAGGLEALYSLLKQAAPSNASFIVIQHISPNFKSITPALLAAQCHREVIAIENNMQVKANCIYALTERKKIEIRRGKIHLTELDPNSKNNTLDIFLVSLAADQGSKSIGIILSGTGNDGTLGAASIKDAGGMVIVQDPVTAEYASMPSNVIAAGWADSILTPASMMNEVFYFLKQSTLLNQFTDKNEALLVELLNLINHHTPLDFSNYKRATIIRRVMRIMNQNNMDLLSDYIIYLKNNPSEIDALSKEFMISVTKFFRDPAAFQFLKDKAIPDLIENKEPNASLKLWVVGCATGEEAYSIAILINEYLEENKRSMEVKIFATDIDKDALAIASRGIYPESIIQDVSKERMAKYFYKEGTNYKIKESIRNMLIIAPHDITKHPPYYKLDLISCRNLLIYLNSTLQKKILATLHYCLNPKGYLFLGLSESLGDLKMKFSEENPKWKIYKNLETAQRLENGTYSIPTFYMNLAKKTMPGLRTTHADIPDGLCEMIADTISKKTDHAGVCIDENYKILSTFGDYKKYLLPEMFNFNLLQMLPHELSIVTATGLNQAVKQKKELTIKEVVFMQNDSPRSITIFIKPLAEYKDFEKILMVCFTEHILEGPVENAEIFNKELYTNRYLMDLEDQLKETQKKLKEAYEALETSNANADSYNEELISSNEELQSTNEEVQSVNEELHTVNNQYQSKIKELAELNDDLNNYFRSTTIYGQIYVDSNFIIRKFTPAVVKQINVKESDIGRPISDISTNIKFSSLMEDMRNVVASSHYIEKEIEALDRRWYQMVLLPYIRQQDNKTDGVIVSFNDITDLKLSQKKLMRINEDHNTFIYSASHDLKAPAINIEGLVYHLTSIIRPEDGELKEIAGLINTSVIKLKDTISELSDITKIEKECSEELIEKINCKILLDEIKLSIRDMLIKSNLQITYDFQEEEINFAKKNLRSILINLLTNAIKYRSPARDLEIEIRTKRQGDYIILSVKDNGLGISKDKQSKIFSIFKRVHQEEGIEGTGIGLYLIKKMMLNAGGKITVESESGSGSTFNIWFKNT